MFKINGNKSYNMHTDIISIGLIHKEYEALGEKDYITYLLRVITHEQLHKSIYHNTKNREACVLLDFIDNDLSDNNLSAYKALTEEGKVSTIDLKIRAKEYKELKLMSNIRYNHIMSFLHQRFI